MTDTPDTRQETYAQSRRDWRDDHPLITAEEIEIGLAQQKLDKQP